MAEQTRRGLELWSLEIERWVNFGNAEAQLAHNEGSKHVQIPEKEGDMTLALSAKLVSPSKGKTSTGHCHWNRRGSMNELNTKGMHLKSPALVRII
jgi:hypothetical protein